MVKKIKLRNEEKIIPIDELIIAKNKETDFKGTIYLYFNTNISDFYEVPISELQIMLENEKKRKSKRLEINENNFGELNGILPF